MILDRDRLRREAERELEFYDVLWAVGDILRGSATVPLRGGLRAARRVQRAAGLECERNERLHEFTGDADWQMWEAALDAVGGIARALRDRLSQVRRWRVASTASTDPVDVDEAARPSTLIGRDPPAPRRRRRRFQILKRASSRRKGGDHARSPLLAAA